jgi:hypothetical protein
MLLFAAGKFRTKFKFITNVCTHKYRSHFEDFIVKFLHFYG